MFNEDRTPGPCPHFRSYHKPVPCPGPALVPRDTEGLGALSFGLFLGSVMLPSPGAFSPISSHLVQIFYPYNDHPEHRHSLQCDRKLETTWVAYWNALVKRLLHQSTLLIDINEIDDNVTELFVHRGSVVVDHGNALTRLLRSMTDLCLGLLFLRPLSYLLSPPALASFHTVPVVGF